jgi:hypothetical protein
VTQALTQRAVAGRTQQGYEASMKLMEVKSLGGTNFVRADRVLALQLSPTGATVIVMEGGAVVNSTESTIVIAARLAAATADA